MTTIQVKPKNCLPPIYYRKEYHYGPPSYYKHVADEGHAIHVNLARPAISKIKSMTFSSNVKTKNSMVEHKIGDTTYPPSLHPSTQAEFDKHYFETLKQLK